MRARTLLLAALLVAVPLAGCLGAEAVVTERRFTASGGKVSPGWAYDGAGVAAGSATLDGWVNDPDNVGQVNVTFSYQGAEYVAVFDQFAEASGKSFQDGGIAFDLDEHGDTGVADASIPRIHAVVAAWGKAVLAKEGEPLTTEGWSAHLMISADTVRGADGRILNAAGNAPYDPSKPGDALRVENDPQALFFVKHPEGETYVRAPVTGTAGGDVAGSSQNIAIAEIPAEKGAASVTVNYTVAAGSAPVPVGQVTLRVVNASGETIATLVSEEPVAPNAALVGGTTLDAAQIDGPLSVVVDGLGFYNVAIDYAVAYADTPFLVVTWDDVLVN